MTVKILLVTTTVASSAYRLAGAFAAVGAAVDAVFPRDHVLAVSRYLGGAHRYQPLSGPASVAEAIRQATPDHIVPCDDRALMLLQQISAGAPQIQRRIEYSLGPAESYRILTARAASIAAARDEGIAAPLTVAVESLNDLPKVLAEVGLPCVMKADFSWGGEGVRIIHSEEEAEHAFVRLQGPPSRLRSLVRAALRDDLHFLESALHPAATTVNVQALVPGLPATSVFAAKDGRVLAAQHMDVLAASGNTGPARLMQRVTDPRMDEAAAKIAARFKLNGFIGLDFMRDASGVAHLIEINPRATQICHLPLDSDLPAALCATPVRPPVTGLKTIALFPQLLTMGELPAWIYRDIPSDDPEVLRLLSEKAQPEAGTDEIDALLHPENYRPARHWPV